MNEIGRRIYYDVATGNVIINTGERSESVIETTIDQDIEAYSALSERNRDTFDVLQFEYGQYAQDFAACNGYRVNLETREMEFSYPDPEHPEQPPVYRKPLSVEVDLLGEQMVQHELTSLDLRQQNDVLGGQMVEKDLQILDLQSQNEALGNTVVGLELRLLELEAK